MHALQVGTVTKTLMSVILMPQCVSMEHHAPTDLAHSLVNVLVATLAAIVHWLMHVMETSATVVTMETVASF